LTIINAVSEPSTPNPFGPITRAYLEVDGSISKGNLIVDQSLKQNRGSRICKDLNADGQESEPHVVLDKDPTAHQLQEYPTDVYLLCVGHSSLPRHHSGFLGLVLNRLCTEEELYERIGLVTSYSGSHWQGERRHIKLV
jgi:hypothetical protein